jgi:type 1 glutamine amidotransferase
MSQQFPFTCLAALVFGSCGGTVTERPILPGEASGSDTEAGPSSANTVSSGASAGSGSFEASASCARAGASGNSPSGSGSASGSTSGGSSSPSGSTSTSASGSTNTSGTTTAGNDASVASTDASAADPYSGPFKVLVLSKTLDYHHDSIPACQQMLRELGRCVDATSCAMAGAGDQPIAGAKPSSTFTVDVAGAPSSCVDLPTESKATTADYTAYANLDCDGNTTDLSQFGATNLDTRQFSTTGAPQGPYQMIFFCSPTGSVFSAGGANGAAGMTAIQNFITAGGAFGGAHAAIDFEIQSGFPWYTNELMGGYWVDQNDDGTPGSVNIAPMYTNHPVMRGIPNPWNVDDEWYLENRDISSQPGFQVLATLSGVTALPEETAGEVRPIVWIKPFSVASDPTGTLEGRMFYSARGHDIIRYGETAFRQLVHQGILWATHRLN